MSNQHDEHNALIDALIADDARDPSTLYFILREGFEGYANYSINELWEEMNTRGLTL